MRVKVAPDIAGLRKTEYFSYLVPSGMEAEVAVGKRVLVKLGGRPVQGFIISCEDDQSYEGTLQQIIRVIDESPLLNQGQVRLAEWIAENNLAPISRVLAAMLPAGLMKNARESRHVEYGDNGEPAAGLDQDQATDKLPGSMCYRPKPDFTPDMVARLEKRAPRQARVMRYFLKQKQPVPERMAIEQFGNAVMAALVAKGLLVREKDKAGVFQHPLLTVEQAHVIKEIADSMDRREHKVFLLRGVTGSGKTEVYLRLIEKAREQGRQALILIPEIGLTQQIIDVFYRRLGGSISVLHSRLRDSERIMEWMRIRNGGAEVVVGARSAVFAPCERLGLIIIDEEQESAFRQEEIPRYHARDVAVERGRIEGAVVVLGSATPSLESSYLAAEGEYRLLTMEEKIGSGHKRHIQLADMKKEWREGRFGYISRELAREIKNSLQAKEQVILFLNRRGYSTGIVCKECGKVMTCSSCDISMTYHIDIDRAVCHYCGRQVRVAACSRCGDKGLRKVGVGIQKIEQEVKDMFPQASVTRMDADTTKGRTGHARIIEKIRNRTTDIVVGTQMVAKGFDFPGVSLVGVINADPMLGLPDFRARERTFQMLVQVAGRAGRGAAPGKVIIQTCEPENPFFALVASEDYQKFYQEEIEYRRSLSYPPFAHLVKILFTGPELKLVREEAEFARNLIEEITGELALSFDILGPAPCFYSRIKNQYRHQILLKGEELGLMREVTRYIIERVHSSKVKVDADVNPELTL